MTAPGWSSDGLDAGRPRRKRQTRWRADEQRGRRRLGPGSSGWTGWIGGPNSDAAIGTSVDGIVWSRVPHDEEAIGNGLMWDLVNTDGGLLAVRTDGTNAAVWVGPEYVKGER